MQIQWFDIFQYPIILVAMLSIPLWGNIFLKSILYTKNTILYHFLKVTRDLV